MGAKDWLKGGTFVWLGPWLWSGLGVVVALAVYVVLTTNTIDETSVEGVLTSLGALIKDQLAPLLMMCPSVLLGVAYQRRQFAKEGFHDMFSISMTLFVKTKDNQYALAIRTLREVPIRHVLFEDGPMAVLQAAVAELKDTNGTNPFHFVTIAGNSDASRQAARLRAHLSSELSSLMGVFQALSAMRVGDVVTRHFCWALSYEPSSVFKERPTFKAVAQSLIALRRLSHQPLAIKDPPVEEVVIEHNPNKFRLILVEADCLRRAHLRRSTQIRHEIASNYSHRRWATIVAMQDLFDLATGQPYKGSTTLCGSVLFSSPTMAHGASFSTEMAPWDDWE